MNTGNVNGPGANTISSVCSHAYSHPRTCITNINIKIKSSTAITTKVTKTNNVGIIRIGLVRSPKVLVNGWQLLLPLLPQ